MLNIQCFLLHLGAFAPPQLPCGGVSFVRPWWWDAAFRHWHPIEKATLAEARAKGPIPAPACIFVPDTRLGCRAPMRRAVHPERTLGRGQPVCKYWGEGIFSKEGHQLVA
jgi:hypothetical protein